MKGLMKVFSGVLDESVLHETLLVPVLMYGSENLMEGEEEM